MKPFIQPEPEELEGSGISDTTSQPWTPRARWRALDDMTLEDVLAMTREELEAAPAEQRDWVLTWLAREIGHSRRTTTHDKRRERLLSDLLDPRRYRDLSDAARAALAILASSTPESRPTLHPVAATAAIVLLRHNPDDEHALSILSQRALPDDPTWLLKIVKSRRHTPSLGLTLARLSLNAGFSHIAASLAALTLLDRHGPRRANPTGASLQRVCDNVALEDPRAERAAIELMCDAALQGRLDHPWLERIVQAGIRLNIDNPERQETLRAFHQPRRYEADHKRLASLYANDIEIAARTQQDALLTEARRLATRNPLRAQMLLELRLARVTPKRRPATLDTHIESALMRQSDETLSSPSGQLLLSLYVKNCTLTAHAASLVRRGQSGLTDLVEPTDLDLYLVISDYERAFRHLMCKYDGVAMTQADKHAAQRVTYFVEKRLDPGAIGRLLETSLAPVEWLGSQFAGNAFLGRAVGQGLAIFERRSQNLDLTQDVVGELQELAPDLLDFHDISTLNLDVIERSLQARRAKRILLGALAGGLSAGLAPLSWGLVSMGDLPVVLAICADICSRFCWYYGFDPREHPELPMDILAVALGGGRASAVGPMLLRQNIKEFVVKKSLMVNALHQGAVTQVAGRALHKIIEQQLGPKLTEQAAQYARRAVRNNLQQRAAQRALPNRAMPLISAALGASMNVALLYDICEAAQAVLTDRFLERKYPDWIRQFDA